MTGRNRSEGVVAQVLDATVFKNVTTISKRHTTLRITQSALNIIDGSKRVLRVPKWSEDGVVNNPHIQYQFRTGRAVLNTRLHLTAKLCRSL